MGTRVTLESALKGDRSPSGSQDMRCEGVRKRWSMWLYGACMQTQVGYLRYRQRWAVWTRRLNWDQMEWLEVTSG